MTDIDWGQLSDEELAAAPQEIWLEQHRRSVLANAQRTIQETNLAYLDAAGVESGQDWVQPTGAHDSYPVDWIVAHEGKTWVSLVNGNAWEPGKSGWREVVEESEAPPDWVQPTGGHDAYPKGAQVTHNEQVWESLIDANVWEPGTEGTESLWRAV